MDITPIIPAHVNTIKAYGNGGFVIKGEPIKGNVLVAGLELVSWHISDLTALADEEILATIPIISAELLLIGTGIEHMQLSRPLIDAISNKLGCSVDVMSTGAACRTYNILIAEGRNVAALLVAVL